MEDNVASTVILLEDFDIPRTDFTSIDLSTSVYAHINRPSASELSNLPRFDLINVAYCKAQYHHNDDMNSLFDDHEQTCKNIESFIESTFPRDSGFEFVRQINCKLASVMTINEKQQQLFVRSNQKPDVLANCFGKTFLLMEVHSIKSNDVYEDYKRTIRKACLSLAEQLRCIRRCNPDIPAICGYYFPTDRAAGTRSIEKVTCSWDDCLLKFSCMCSAFHTMDTFVTDFKNVFSQQYCLFRDCPPEKCISVLPLSTSFVEQHFGNGAKQLPSGESFVILSGDFVYKRSINLVQNERLHILLNSELMQLSQFCIPVGEKIVSGLVFYKFPKHLPPVDVFQLRQTLQSPIKRKVWLRSLVMSIKELHSVGIAHLDIRLPNICYKQTTGEVILIDVDRSVHKLKFGSKVAYAILESQYEGAVMYSTDNFDFDNGDISDNILKLDWKQLAILLLHIEDSAIDYYTTAVDLDNVPCFVKRLYNGIFDESCFEQFLVEAN